MDFGGLFLLVWFFWMVFTFLLLIHIASEVEKISATLGRILEHLENCLLALRSLLEESGEARVEGLRDKEGRLGRIGKFLGVLEGSRYSR